MAQGSRIAMTSDVFAEILIDESETAQQTEENDEERECAEVIPSSLSIGGVSTRFGWGE